MQQPAYPDFDYVVDVAIDLMQMESIEDAFTAVDAALSDLRVSIADYELYFNDAVEAVDQIIRRINHENRDM